MVTTTTADILRSACAGSCSRSLGHFCFSFERIKELLRQVHTKRTKKTSITDAKKYFQVQLTLNWLNQVYEIKLECIHSYTDRDGYFTGLCRFQSCEFYFLFEMKAYFPNKNKKYRRKPIENVNILFITFHYLMSFNQTKYVYIKNTQTENSDEPQRKRQLIGNLNLLVFSHTSLRYLYCMYVHNTFDPVISY